MSETPKARPSRTMANKVTSTLLKKVVEEQAGYDLKITGIIPFDSLARLCEALSSNTVTRRLDLEGCGVGDRGCVLIQELMSQSECLETLDLTLNQITDSGLRLLADAIRQGTAVRSIWLGDNDITDKGVDMLIEAVEQGPNVFFSFRGCRKITSSTLTRLENVQNAKGRNDDQQTNEETKTSESTPVKSAQPSNSAKTPHPAGAQSSTPSSGSKRQSRLPAATSSLPVDVPASPATSKKQKVTDSSMTTPRTGKKTKSASGIKSKQDDVSSPVDKSADGVGMTPPTTMRKRERAPKQQASNTSSSAQKQRSNHATDIKLDKNQVFDPFEVEFFDKEQVLSLDKDIPENGYGKKSVMPYWLTSWEKMKSNYLARLSLLRHALKHPHALTQTPCTKTFSIACSSLQERHASNSQKHAKVKIQLGDDDDVHLITFFYFAQAVTVSEWYQEVDSRLRSLQNDFEEEKKDKEGKIDIELQSLAFDLVDGGAKARLRLRCPFEFMIRVKSIDNQIRSVIRVE